MRQDDPADESQAEAADAEDAFTLSPEHEESLAKIIPRHSTWQIESALRIYLGLRQQERDRTPLAQSKQNAKSLLELTNSLRVAINNLDSLNDRLIDGKLLSSSNGTRSLSEIGSQLAELESIAASVVADLEERTKDGGSGRPRKRAEWWLAFDVGRTLGGLGIKLTETRTGPYCQLLACCLEIAGEPRVDVRPFIRAVRNESPWPLEWKNKNAATRRSEPNRKVRG